MKSAITRVLGKMGLIAMLSFQPLAMAADDAKGPTPFPDAKDEAGWPGKGPIRVFPAWMVDNRNWFWSQREKDQGAVVFAGDSNTGNWKAEQMAELFPNTKIANRGIGGDVSRGLLFRFKEDVLSLHPKLVVINIGSNDLTAYGDPADAAENIAAMIALAKAQDPALPIVLCTTPPSDSAKAPVKPGARENLNERIKKIAAGAKQVELFDLYALLVEKDGKPTEHFFGPDKLHLAPEGYVKWAEGLRPVLAKILAEKPLATTTSGATLPAGWCLKVADRFGTNATCTVQSMQVLHAKYYESQYYNRDAQGLVRLPNVVINKEQQTYVHFETAVAFAPDYLTIQGRGHPDGSITSGEMVSKYTARSWCVEARYRMPSADKSWMGFWFYAGTTGNDNSEIDFEQLVGANLGVHDVTMFNHPHATNVTTDDPSFTTKEMTWRKTTFDGSTVPHTYTALYDDTTGTVTRFIDGHKIYTANFKWNASLGGTGHGPDACTIINLAIGGAWPGNLAKPADYHGDLDIYSIEYYGPVTAPAIAPTSTTAPAPASSPRPAPTK